MDVQPFECTVVEDAVPGVQAARAAGMRALAYAGAPHAHREALQAAGGRLFDDMSSFPTLCCHERPVVDGRRQARARDRGRRRHGGPCRRAAVARFGLRVTVLEARDRLGGRTWTDCSLGAPLDLGGSWVHGVEGNPLTLWCGKLGVAPLNRRAIAC